MERIAYHPRLWRKHLLQYYVYADLNLPEIGLSGGESPSERTLWRAAMLGVGVSDGLQGEALRQYKELRDREPTIRGLLRKRDKQSGSPFLQVSKLASLFARSAREAGVEDHPDFLSNREQLFWNALVELGVYYDVYGAGYLREAVALFSSGEEAKDLAPFVQEGRTLLDEGQEVPPDVAVEISGYARRALLLYGPGPLTQAGLGRAPALGRFALHRFKNFLRFVVGASLSKLSGEALLDTALSLAAGTRFVDQEIIARLDDLLQGKTPAPHYEGEPDPVLEAQVSASLHRLARARQAITQAWADGWVSPEERVLLRYLFPHVLGVHESAIQRFFGDAAQSNRLCDALAAYVEK